VQQNISNIIDQFAHIYKIGVLLAQLLYQLFQTFTIHPTVH